MNGPALHTTDLCKSFGGLTVTNCVNFSLGRGARHALIGPNGAGKSSLVHLLTGFLRPSGGQIFLNGARIDRSMPCFPASHHLNHLCSQCAAGRGCSDSP